MMKTMQAVLLVLVAMFTLASGVSAKVLVLEPTNVAAIVSKANARDARVLVYFDLPKQLLGSKVEIDNTILTFKAEVSDAEYGMVHIFPVSKDWRTAGSVGWESPWENPGGDFSKDISGRSITLKRDRGDKEVKSNVLFIVKAWVDGSMPNNGFVILPSEADLSSSSVKYAIDQGSIKLKIHLGD